jgi:RNA polymerase sigma factor (TIGR02999 family)
MSDVTLALLAIEQGDPRAAERLLSLIYQELRALAASKVAREKATPTLQATSLVHDAYLRLLGTDPQKQHWDSRGHFFAAASEAMRRILIENARRKKRIRHGGGRQRIELLDDAVMADEESPDQLLALNDALASLAAEDPQAEQLVKLRFFGGLSIEQAGELLGFSRAAAYRQWNYARAWLRCRIEQGQGN